MVITYYIVGMKPSLYASTVQVFACNWRHTHYATFLDITINWVGHYIFLIFWTKIVLFSVTYNLLQQLWRHDILTHINQIRRRFIYAWLLYDTR